MTTLTMEKLMPARKNVQVVQVHEQILLFSGE